ncbi:AzlD family protein [Dictyobacter kobayashii]|uniref:Branched-chain amino acid ABC transporter n=1 Tax=Dictyobacter kobayashii TaxID=2014872 RepID=A0A402AYT2_9CHLR|nr:AzlD domain-containing protein [Dictyobacter kobayashii]GCE24271.1 hypothetical protein KDK_80710 [Dictyobacter kobayashii]
MQTSLPAILAICGMAIVTYITRIGGLWLMGHVAVSARTRAWLGYLPGTILVAIVAPTVLSTGWSEAGASLATILVAARTRNLLLSMIVGIGAAIALRALL